MELSSLIVALSDPAAYPRSAAVDAVEVHQTHISVGFLAATDREDPADSEREPMVSTPWAAQE